MSTATPQDVQAKLDKAITALRATTTSGSKWIIQHGSDWTKWPTNSNWYIAFSNIAGAKTEVGNLVAPAPPTAAFTTKEV